VDNSFKSRWRNLNRQISTLDIFQIIQIEDMLNDINLPIEGHLGLAQQTLW